MNNYKKNLFSVIFFSIPTKIDKFCQDTNLYTFLPGSIVPNIMFFGRHLVPL